MLLSCSCFHFHLRDVTANWFESLPYGSMKTWEELVEAYLSRFFPPALTSERIGDIIAFKHKEDRSLYNA